MKRPFGAHLFLTATILCLVFSPLSLCNEEHLNFDGSTQKCSNTPQITHHGEIPVISPSQTLFFQEIQPGATKYYRLENIDQDGTYTIRVSHPSVMPAVVDIEIICKLSNQTDKREGYDWYGLVTMKRESKSFNPEIERQKIIFNVDFERTYFGVSTQTFKLIALVMVCLSFVFIWCDKIRQKIEEIART